MFGRATGKEFGLSSPRPDVRVEPTCQPEEETAIRYVQGGLMKVRERDLNHSQTPAPDKSQTAILSITKLLAEASKQAFEKLKMANCSKSFVFEVDIRATRDLEQSYPRQRILYLCTKGCGLCQPTLKEPWEARG
ncbi:hypothetical protein RRG08_021864 [Elysia crispata]|uniref:Uncharacterized protein n=1 Tax=Elysia crispata TaxID=231223 RepID=A0AAE1B9P9_9GAST|nr:hypothetical protein RRG08_021864 [Elysia crispata]